MGTVGTVIHVESPSDLADLPAEYRALGAGSNVLIDPEVSVPLVKVSPVYMASVVTDYGVACSAGATVATVSAIAQQRGLSGLEFATGVPASIGGMVYMNFSCWGQVMADVVHRVLVYTPGQGLQWRDSYATAYRWTAFHESNDLIVAVELALKPANPETIQATMMDYLTQRKQKQPVRARTFGSVFKNPEGDYAARLIEAAGLKGYAVGGACVSRCHANFIENTGNATYANMMTVITHVQNTVKSRYNIQLECEVQILGFKKTNTLLA
jgi:UDP-N-acetylmuramate dehydrogenase